MAKGGNTLTTLASNVRMPNLGIKQRLTGRSGGKKRSAKKTKKARKSRKNKKSRKSRKGGFPGAIEQAIVPFGLLAVQKRMQKRSRKGTRKN